MAMYTGIKMYKRIDGVEDEILQQAQFYEKYKGVIKADDQYGGYPTMLFMMDALCVDWDDSHDDSDTAYYQLQAQFAELVTKANHVVNEIESNKILQKREEEEVYFTSRNYPLAHKFGELFDFPKFYHRKLIDADELIFKLNTIDKDWCIEHKCSFEWAIEKIKEHKDEWVFEVYVN